ncbi:hypothetical protein [Amantichitinum ursilacus]|uniref:Uncharacterized protein n=1 Tax=Amantichitinum ursilacus TaxID=857265 RepID=A0A0N0GQ83_9NEIS|nr:hypothetical protein [Amantichitinum ursilacus]KPC54450.1 hypothetical protein WG78_02700 [Amantichitinum ursilacus]
MSRLWIEHTAWLTRRHVLLASGPRINVGQKKGTPQLHRAHAAVQPVGDDAVLRLQQLLAHAPRGSLGLDQLHLLMGAPWVRYAVMPWQTSLKREADWEGYARVLLAQQYGVATDTWRIRVAPGGFGQARLAAAVDQGLFQTVYEMARASKLRLSQCEPLLITAINRHHARLKAREFVLVLLEAEYATCLFFNKGWHSVITQPYATPPHHAPDADQITALVRDAAVLGGETMPAQIYVSSSDIPLSSLSGQGPIQWLGGVHPRFSQPIDLRAAVEVAA